MKNLIFSLSEEEERQVGEAAAVLKRGGVVAFPTETVYGLGADATNLAAIQRVYKVKQRPLGHPVIVHLSDFSQISDWVSEVGLLADKLISRFWPGSLTLILKKTHRVFDEITGGQDTVAVRMPAHPVALALIDRVGRPLIAPSANRFGRISPTHSDHVKQGLGDAVDFIVEGGNCRVGIESTILDVSSDEPKILRLGVVKKSQIEAALDMKLPEFKAVSSGVRVPGALAQHYAPRNSLLVVPPLALSDVVARYLSKGKTLAVLSQQKPSFCEKDVFWVQMPAVPEDYMAVFYRSLYLADQEERSVILVESPPETEAWVAVLDRMARAAHD